MKIEGIPQRVLIVDDAPVVREALRWIFGELVDWLVVGEAGDGLEALTQVTALLPDVVILDIELPGMDGYTVARLLKALPDAPLVLFLSVHGDAAARQQAMAAGGDSFVEKGAGWQVLIQEIRRLMMTKKGGDDLHND